MSTIREDVVSISFDVEDNPFASITAGIDEMKAAVVGGVDDSTEELKGIAKGANEAADGVGDLANAAKGLKGTNTDGLTDSVKKTKKETQETQKTFTQMIKSMRDAAKVKIGGGLDKLKSIPQQAKGGFDKLKNSIQSIKNIKLGDIGRALDKGLGKAITGCIKGAKSLAKGLKNAAQVTFTKAVSGLKSIATHAKNATAALGRGLVTGAKAVTAGVGAAAVAVGGLVAKSVSAYADQQQLVGGVETLFGTGGKNLAEYAQSVGKTVKEVSGEFFSMRDAQNTVMKNANNAYKTAGLSANEYMETVTSFSASLINSVGGDTQKAADMADMALTDMSDNANKMGTDMELIQNAYQGFAKQNYTMLDNLKLGYGGTKSEMERLLADAQKLTGVKYDMNNLADVYSAIHAVQGEMGISGRTADEVAEIAKNTGRTVKEQLGTTAKEANETISGSLASMKSAWGNLLPALVQGGDSFDQCVNNLVESVRIFAGNIMPAVKSALSGVGSLISELAPIIAKEIPSLVDSVLPSLISAAMSIVQGLISALPGIVTTLAEALPTVITGLLDALMQAIQGLADMIKSNMSTFADIATTIVTSISQFILQALPQLVVVGAEMMARLAAGNAQQLPTLIPLAVEAVTTIVDGLISCMDSLVQAAMQIVSGLAQGLIANLPTIITAALELLLGIVNSLLNNIQLIINTALQLIDALVNGLLMNLPAIINAALQLVMGLLNGIIANIDLIVNGALQLVMALVQGLLQALPQILQAAMQLVFGLVGGLLANITTIVQAGFQLIMGLIDGIIQMLPQIVLMGVQLIIQLVTGLTQNLSLIIEGAVQLIVALATGLIQAIPKLVSAIPEIVSAIIEGLMSVDWIQVGKDLIGGVWDGIKSLFSDGEKSGKEAATSVASGINTNSYMATTAGNNLAASTTNSMQLNNTAISGFGTAGATSLASGVTDGTGLATAAAGNLAANTTSSLQLGDTTNLGVTAGNNLASGLNASTGSVANAASGLSAAASNAAATEVEVNINADTESLEGFKESVQSMVTGSTESLGELKQAFTTNMLVIKNIVTIQVNAMKTQFAAGMTAILSSANSTANGIRSVFGSLDLSSAGVNIMQGLNNGLNSMRGTLMATANSIAQSIATTINSALDIHSPSRVMIESGEYTGQGLAIGMQNMADTVKQSAGGLSTATTTAIQPPVTQYTPGSSSVSTTNNNRSTTNTFNPQFTINMNGASATEGNKRKIKQWVKESINEVFESMGRIDPELQEA